MSAQTTNIRGLLGLRPSSEQLSAHISSLASLVSGTTSTGPEIKSYPDVVYFNYYPLGLSLQFKPIHGYKPKTGLRHHELREEDLVVDGIDLYNEPRSAKLDAQAARTKPAYATYPLAPFSLSLVPISTRSHSTSMSVDMDTTGKDFVSCLGEPDRKGGGAGPSSGSIGIWCEWARDGVMVEFGGDDSRGPQAWERGKDARWKIISLFQSQPS